MVCSSPSVTPPNTSLFEGQLALKDGYLDGQWRPRRQCHRDQHWPACSPPATWPTRFTARRSPQPVRLHGSAGCRALSRRAVTALYTRVPCAHRLCQDRLIALRSGARYAAYQVPRMDEVSIRASARAARRACPGRGCRSCPAACPAPGCCRRGFPSAWRSGGWHGTPPIPGVCFEAAMIRRPSAGNRSGVQAGFRFVEHHQ